MIRCHGTRRHHKLLRIPQPSNDAEFAILTEWYFGAPLSVKRLSVGDYEITEDYNSYHGDGFKYGGSNHYDHSQALMDFVFGKLGTGGVARAAYGSTTLHGYRHKKRIQAWVDERNNIRRGSKGSPPRKSFERLAGLIRARREQTEAGLCLS